MATALSMITRAMRLCGAIGKGETLEDVEAADGLEALNAMLDSWQLERLFVYQIVQGSYTWPASTASRTIGSSGDFNATRPDRIDSAFIVDANSQWYPLDVLRDRVQYDSIVTKTVTSNLPQWIYMEPAYPLATLYMYPLPTVSLTLKLNTWNTLQNFTSLTTALSLPPGYERAITYSLMEEYGPELGGIIPKPFPGIAQKARKNIKSINSPSMVADLPVGIGARSGNGQNRYNIYSDS